MKHTPYKLLKFSNGLTLILQTMPSVNSVSVYVAVSAGSRYETKETAGTAHFLEHMLFEGTKNWPSSKKVAEYIERIGGRSGAWTDREYVTYYVKIPKQHLEIAFRYLAEIFFNSTLTNEAIEKEKGIIMEELKRKTDNPEVEIWDLWFEWVWGKNQSMGRSIIGNEATIQKMTQKQLRDYMTRSYHPANMVIAVVGNFSHKEVENYTLKYFGRKKRRKVPAFKKSSFIPKKVPTKIIKAKTHQVQLILGFVTNISYTHKDRFPLRVIADVLSGGVSARLFHKLIYELGIAYSAGAQSWIFADTGLFYIYGGFSAENLEIAIRTISEELKKLKKEKISAQELKEVKEKGKANIIFSLETPDALAYWYASQQITEKKIMTPEEILGRIDQVTAADIQRVARQYFNSNNLCLTMRGLVEEENTQRIENMLHRL